MWVPKTNDTIEPQNIFRHRFGKQLVKIVNRDPFRAVRHQYTLDKEPINHAPLQNLLGDREKKASNLWYEFRVDTFFFAREMIFVDPLKRPRNKFFLSLSQLWHHEAENNSQPSSCPNPSYPAGFMQISHSLCVSYLLGNLVVNRYRGLRTVLVKLAHKIHTGIDGRWL